MPLLCNFFGIVPGLKAEDSYGAHSGIAKLLFASLVPNLPQRQRLVKDKLVQTRKAAHVAHRVKVIHTSNLTQVSVCT